MRVLIIGLGQMGGSLAAAAKKAGHYVIGYNRNKTVIDYGLKQGIIHEGLYELSGAAELVIDIVVIGAALGAYPEIFCQLDKIVQPSWVVTDMGSVKEYVMNLAMKTENLKRVFIGGHPMAGAEKVGIENLSANLFENRRWFYTAFHSDVYGGDSFYQAKVEVLRELITSIRSNAIKIDAAVHDTHAASASHLPQILSVLLAASLMENHPKAEYLDIAGGGFRDVSRLAGSSSDIWRDILFLNKDNLQKELSDFSYLLGHFMDVLETQDHEKTDIIFKEGNTTRRLFLGKAKELGIDL